MLLRLLLVIFGLALSASSSGMAGSVSCPRQPLPSPMDSLSPLPNGGRSISFAAASSFGGQAWAIRLHRSGYAAPGTLEILHLRRQIDCNRYDIETKWQAPVSPAEYASLTEAIAPFASASPQVFSEISLPKNYNIIIFDGTGITLKVKTTGWEVTRSLNHYEHGGAELSSIFHRIVSKHVPEWEIPMADWSPRSK